MRQFVNKDTQIATFLDGLIIPMYAVRGNHEDHDFLDTLEMASDKNSPCFSIDCYQKVHVLKTGRPITLHNDSDSISLMGIGRIGDNKNRKDKKFIQDYEKA